MLSLHSRPNEESNKLVNKIIESDDALKVTIGVAELLIFPSCLLPEQSQCKHPDDELFSSYF
jgi:hypothetical protein